MFALDWLQSPVTIVLIILFDNPLKQNQNNTMAIKAGHYFGLILVDY